MWNKIISLSFEDINRYVTRSWGTRSTSDDYVQLSIVLLINSCFACNFVNISINYSHFNDAIDCFLTIWKQKVKLELVCKVILSYFDIYRLNSRVDFFIILLKMFLVIIFAFLQDASFNGFKILILVIFSTMTFSKYYSHRPFFNNNVNNVRYNL